MSRSVLVIHGAGEPRRRGRKVYWEPMLGNTLGRDYSVMAPRMPEPTEPRYETWARRIAELIGGTKPQFPELAADIRSLEAGEHAV